MSARCWASCSPAVTPAPRVDAWRVLADALGISGDRLHQGPAPGLHPGRAGAVHLAERIVAWLGEVDPGILAALAIPERVAVLEVDLGLLLGLPHGRQAYEPVSRYPSSDIDLAFVVAESVPAGDVRTAIAEAAGELLVGLRLFDVFRSESLPAGTRSLAFTLRFQAQDRTLTDDEIAGVRSTVIAAVESRFGATLRS